MEGVGRGSSREERSDFMRSATQKRNVFQTNPTPGSKKLFIMFLKTFLFWP